MQSSSPVSASTLHMSPHSDSIASREIAPPSSEENAIRKTAKTLPKMRNNRRSTPYTRTPPSTKSIQSKQVCTSALPLEEPVKSLLHLKHTTPVPSETSKYPVESPSIVSQIAFDDDKSNEEAIQQAARTLLEMRKKADSSEESAAATTLLEMRKKADSSEENAAATTLLEIRKRASEENTAAITLLEIRKRAYDDGITQKTNDEEVRQTATTPLKMCNSRRSFPHKHTPYTKPTQPKQTPVLTNTLSPLVCRSSLHTLNFMRGKLVEFKKNFIDPNTSNSQYTEHLQNILHALKKIEKQCSEKGNEAVSLSKGPLSSQASPQNEAVVLKHATVTDTDALCTSEDQPSSQTTEDPSNLNATQRKHYDCLMTSLPHRAWMYIAQNFMSIKELGQLINCISDVNTPKKDKWQHKMHKVCILLVQKKESKEEIIEYLDHAMDNKYIPETYIKSVKNTVLLLKEIK